MEVNRPQPMASPDAGSAIRARSRRRKSLACIEVPSCMSCMAASPSTDSPPGSPKRAHSKSSKWSPKQLMQRASGRGMASPSPDSPAGASKRGTHPEPASASVWSPKQIMQRASRALRGESGSRKNRDSPRSAKGSNNSGRATFVEEHHLYRRALQQDVEEVPEKIIHEDEANLHQQPAKYRFWKTPERETAPAAEEEEGPKKGAAPAPAVAAGSVDAIKDKFVVVKESPRKREIKDNGALAKESPKKREEAIKEEAMAVKESPRKREEGMVMRFLRTAMEKLSDEESPRKRDAASPKTASRTSSAEKRSPDKDEKQLGSRVRTVIEKQQADEEHPRKTRLGNEVIEEALRLKGNTVKVLVETYETIDAPTDDAAAAAKTNKFHLRSVSRG